MIYPHEIRLCRYTAWHKQSTKNNETALKFQKNLLEIIFWTEWSCLYVLGSKGSRSRP
ncbi:hypothetical protein [Phascolarctobacterium faecium]|uniref:hypothetical protein n=1 Tax=Phascolarctobacterium faecium TaxID=33025 RepID=UPI0026760AEA|nr:hypothetical protein [Phascolarctobacterium faecium]